MTEHLKSKSTGGFHQRDGSPCIIHWIKKIHALLLQILYLDATKKTVDYLTDAVEVFVGKELTMFENQRTIPFVVFITLVWQLL